MQDSQGGQKMKSFRVEYVACPTNYSPNQSMSIEAETLDDALITAIITLDRRGIGASCGTLGHYGAPRAVLSEAGREKLAQFKRGASGQDRVVIHNAYEIEAAELPGRVWA
jgi:hypothetical protein